MKLIQRFGYYLGGFGIGVVLVIFILAGKGTSCSYFPNARVLKEIRYKQPDYAPQVTEFMQKNQIDSTVIKKLLHQGKVDFDASETSTKAPCRIYVINGEFQKKGLQIQVKECKETEKKATITKAQFITSK